MVATATGLRVVQHDDGSADGMHDLDLFDAAHRIGAIEVTAAVDGELIALWNLINGRGERWIEPALKGGWMVTLDLDARGKGTRKETPGLLYELDLLESRASNRVAPRWSISTWSAPGAS